MGSSSFLRPHTKNPVRLRQGPEPTEHLQSWIACALGHKAYRNNRSVLYQRLPCRSIHSPSHAATAGIPGYSNMLARVDLLIRDDWDLAPILADQRRDLSAIVENQHGCGSTVVTSRLPVARWRKLRTL